MRPGLIPALDRASFLSTFLIELLSSLQPDPMEAIQDILIRQTYMMRNSSVGSYVPPSFSPPCYILYQFRPNAFCNVN